MSIQSAVGYSENVDEFYEAGLEIGDMILEKIALQTNSLGILFCHIEFDFAELLNKDIGQSRADESDAI